MNQTPHEALRILIVDDHAALRRSLLLWLEAVIPGVRLREAGSGEEAIEILGEEEFSAVLMDLSLPGMSGVEATRRILEMKPETKIIAVTQHDSFAHRQDAERVGCVAFVPKTLLGSELARALRETLEIPVGAV